MIYTQLKSQDAGVNRNKVKSNVWQNFLLIFNATNKKKISNFVQCSKCLSFEKYNGSTTTVLNRHKCHKTNSQANIESFFFNKKTNFTKRDTEDIRNACVEFVVSDIRPFYAIEGSGLRNLMKTLIRLSKRYPNLSEKDIERIIPSRQTIQRHTAIKADEIRAIIIVDISKVIEDTGGFSCSIDLYTDKYRSISYLGITANLNIIEEENIIQKRYVLHLDKVDKVEKTGAVIKDEILKTMANFGITEQHIRDNIIWISDRGGNIKNALTLSVRLNCFAHLINNLVEHMCTKDSNMKTIVSDAASLVRFMKKSGLINQKLDGPLKSYIETRWNTVYYMLSSILVNFESIQAILSQRQDDAVLKLIRLPKVVMKTAVEFLKLFADISVHVQGEKFETIHLVWPYFNKIVKHIEVKNSDSSLVKSMKLLGKAYIEKNTTDFKPKMIHKVAVFLHPALKQLQGCSEAEKMEIIDYVKSRIPSNSDHNNIQVTNNTIQQTNNDSLFSDFMVNSENYNVNDTSEFDEVDRYVGLRIPQVCN